MEERKIQKVHALLLNGCKKYLVLRSLQSGGIWLKHSSRVK